jgi:hypothetical protein
VTPRTAWRAAAFALLLSVGSVASVALATTSPPALANAAAPSRAPHATTRRPLATRPATADSIGRSRAPMGSAGARLAPRTLDDIHIEGEIPVPQVLFITARDQRRFMEFQHHRYTRTSLELGRGTALPSRIVVPEPSPVVGKENPR